ncbi:MAG: patatin [Gammaproteobacteria bacterium]|nr:patatin [Gammaproteobacteria bacterium]
MTKETGYKSILTIDGGGIRGLIPARILEEIEKRTKKPTYELFDLIVGTSTGGILATCLARPENGKVGGPCSANELVHLYFERGREIFNRSLWKGVTSLGGLSDEKYDAGPLEGILDEMLGSAELKDTLPDIILTSYDIERREPYLFKTSKARDGEAGRNHLLRHVARATSAAPTFFEAFLLDQMQWVGEKHNRRALVDGGVYANNPSMIGLSEALSSGTHVNDLLLCAIGTGMNDRKIPFEDAKDWGPLGWARPVISVMMDGMSDSADYHARQLLPNSDDHSREQRYFRFDIRLKDALDDLDAAHRANVVALLHEAEKIIDNQADELDLLTKILVNRAKVEG